MGGSTVFCVVLWTYLERDQKSSKLYRSMVSPVMLIWSETAIKVLRAKSNTSSCIGCNDTFTSENFITRVLGKLRLQEDFLSVENGNDLEEPRPFRPASSPYTNFLPACPTTVERPSLESQHSLLQLDFSILFQPILQVLIQGLN